MNRTLRKAIMTKLKRRYNLDRTTISFEKYKKQLNICVNLLRKCKKQCFSNIDLKNVTDNKNIGKLLDHNFRINVKLQTQLF